MRRAGWAAGVCLSLAMLPGCSASGDKSPAASDEPAPASPGGDATSLERAESTPSDQPQAGFDEPQTQSPDPKGAEQAAPPPREQLDEAGIDAALEHATTTLRDLGVRKRSKALFRGPATPLVPWLREAYDDGRAVAYEGKLVEIQQAMGFAKFGTDDRPLTEIVRGPLAGYDLVVTRKEERAWLHVVVPERGPHPDAIGRHLYAHRDELWVALCDHATPGIDYLPFKEDQQPSLDRQWGKRHVIEHVVDIARSYRDEVGSLLGVGDISVVTGGKISDHWTHRLGRDVDFYLLADTQGQPHIVYHYEGRKGGVYSTKEMGKGEREEAPEGGLSPTAQRLQALASIVLPIDEVAYFVHDDVAVLEPFDQQAQERRPGRRYLHADNKGYWPFHRDHVHMRWVEGKLPTTTPKP